jgi:hypothetical protein
MMPVSSLWIFAECLLSDIPRVPETLEAMVGPFGRRGNRNHKLAQGNR